MSRSVNADTGRARFHWTGDTPPLQRLNRAGAAGLPIGTIKNDGLRVDVAEHLERHGLATLERDYARPVRPGAGQLGRPVRAYSTQLAFPF